MGDCIRMALQISAAEPVDLSKINIIKKMVCH